MLHMSCESPESGGTLHSCKHLLNFVFTPKFHTNKVLAPKKCVKGQEEMRALKLGDCFDIPEASGELLVVHL